MSEAKTSSPTKKNLQCPSLFFFSWKRHPVMKKSTATEASTLISSAATKPFCMSSSSSPSSVVFRGNLHQLIPDFVTIYIKLGSYGISRPTENASDGSFSRQIREISELKSLHSSSLVGCSNVFYILLAPHITLVQQMSLFLCFSSLIL